MAASERSRSPMGGSPVPACMFAPEPGSPGGRPRVAAAACPLRAAFDAEDGEALNGEPEIDLTSKDANIDLCFVLDVADVEEGPGGRQGLRHRFLTARNLTKNSDEERGMLFSHNLHLCCQPVFHS